MLAGGRHITVSNTQLPNLSFLTPMNFEDVFSLSDKNLRDLWLYNLDFHKFTQCMPENHLFCSQDDRYIHCNTLLYFLICPKKIGNCLNKMNLQKLKSFRHSEIKISHISSREMKTNIHRQTVK